MNRSLIPYRSLLLLCTILSLQYSCKEDTQVNTNEHPVPDTVSNTPTSGFVKVNADDSGILFNNAITHNVATKENLFDYDFFYNGAGVGVADLNNDGLKDVFFCGNQVPNTLYVNKGNLTFEDVTETSGINVNKHWSNGVTFADVNGDGWLDIYVSQGGPFDPSKRKNTLLINQKDLTFKEAGEAYGLADEGISTQTAFFDYDKDGDLDCVVMNENDYYGIDPSNFYKILSDKAKLKQNSSHLYRNDNGHFTDITEKAGLLRPSFGLGLCVSDLNNDGWLDIYISNDYYVPDAMYINNKNGSFTNAIKDQTNQVSFYGMGLDIEDLNNDNLNDIFVLDMASSDHVRSKTLMASMNVPQFNLLTDQLGLQYQYMFNSVQLNAGNNKFHNISQLTGMSKSDWSWAALIFDTDLDSHEDIYVTNGYRRYALDNDSRTNIAKAKQQYRGRVPLEVKAQLYDALPSEKLPNILYKNHGALSFENTTALSELNEPSFSNGAAYADLDNDGDLDLVVNNMDAPAFLFKNTAIEQQLGNYLKIDVQGATSETFAKAQISFNGQVKTKESKRVRGYLSAVDNDLHFGVGKANTIDKITVVWPSGKSEERTNVPVNQTVIFKETDATGNAQLQNASAPYFSKKENSLPFTHKENNFNDFQKEVLLPYKQSTLGPCITKGDLNGDQLEDLFIGGALGQPSALFFQTANGFKKANIPVFTSDKNYEDMEALFIDIDNDKDLDIYVVSGGSEFNERASQLKDRIYINDGSGQFTKHKNSEVDAYTISGKTVTRIDFDQDGDSDIIVGNRIKPQKYPLHEPSLVYENNNGQLQNVTPKVAPDFEDFGIVNKVIATDFNNDGWEDFIAVGEWTHIGLFQNNKGRFEDVSPEYGLDTEKGWWFNVTETDLNNDGLKDYLIGNIGKNIKFKVSHQKPLRIYADDFDANGTHDVVLSHKYNNRFVPVRGKECSTQQMPFISEKMPTFSEFANSTLEDIYGDKIHTAYQREATQFKSLVLLNKGNGKFEKLYLNNLVQTMPIQDAISHDINKDGFEDLLVVGNIYNTEVETPRLDNPYALVLLSNGKDNYDVLGPDKTGLYTEGNAKSVALIERGNETLVVIGNNNDAAEVFLLNTSSK